MSDVLRLTPRNPAPQPIGTRALNRKLKALDTDLACAREHTREFAFCDDDDAAGRLRALQSLDVELLNAHDAIRNALHEVSMLLELAMDDYSRERVQVADLSAERARRAS